MHQPIHILMAEDMPADAELAQREISQVLPGCIFLRVDTRPDYVAALETFQPDLIISDYRMPRFDGLTALKLALERVPLTPVIILTGSMNEDTAVECMKAGATDYVIKEHSKRLGPAVLHALEEKNLRLERHQTEEALRQSENRFRALIEYAPDGIALLSVTRQAGKLQYASPSTYRILGYAPEELIGCDPREFIHPDDVSFLFTLMTEVIQQPEHVITTQYRFRHKDGSWRWLESTISNLLNEPSVGALAFNYHDITERKRTEEALQTSEARYRTLAHTLPDALTVTDLAGNILFLSPSAVQMYGLETEAEALGHNLLEWVHISQHQQALDAITTILAGGFIKNQEYLLLKQDGFPFFGEVSASCLKDAHGQAIGIIIIVRDVSQRKLAEEALRESEERYRTLAEAAEDSIFILNPDDTFQYVNQAVAQLLGRPQAEFVGRKRTDHFPPSIAELQTRLIQKVFETGEPLQDENPIPTPHGQAWLNTLLTPLRDKQGGVSAVLGIARDVTERKRAEAALQASEARLTAIIESAMDAIISVDPEQRIVLFNTAAEKMFGCLASEVLGQPLDRFIPERFRQAHQEYIQTFGRTGITSRVMGALGAIVGQRADGAEFPIEASISQVETEGDKLYTVILRDITERQQAEAALKAERASLAQRVEERTAELSQANAELAQAARAKDEFLANMSHELRTPLNAILGLSESLLEQIRGPLNERQLKSVSTIEKSGRHLLALINDILDLSKVEAGKLELEPETVSASEICQLSLIFVKEMAIQKNIQISCQLADPQIIFQADPRRLKQILVNLLSNAVKFTPPGGQVSLKVTPDPAEQVVHFTVQDNGIGISAADRAKLFKPFTQLDSSLSRQYEGTGLGLALVRRLVELHHGQVWVESQGVPGQGSRFTVALPWSGEMGRIEESQPLPTITIKPLEPTSTPLLSPENENATILLVEDNESNIRTIGDYVGHAGYHVVVARNGAEALQLAGEIKPDLILMDIQIPIMDGLQVTRYLRADPQFARTPIIALTALAMPGDRERCLAAGANDYIVKPVSLKGLVERIKGLLLE